MQRYATTIAHANLCKPCKDLLFSGTFILHIISSFPNLCKPCKDLQSCLNRRTFALGNAGASPPDFRLQGDDLKHI